MTELSTTNEVPSPASDAALLSAAAAGDDDAFRTLFDRHIDAIRSFVIARLGPSDADDVVIETFAVAWKRRSDFHADADSARPWLFGIAATLVRSHRSREAHWHLLQLRAAEQRVTSHGEPALPLDVNLRAAIARLSVGEREVLLLVAIGDMSITDAAMALGIRPVTARMRLLRARRSIARRIGDPANGDRT